MDASNASVSQTPDRDGYYVVRVRKALYGNPLPVELEPDIASYDTQHGWMFCGDSEPYSHDPSKIEVVKYLCDPKCSELL